MMLSVTRTENLFADLQNQLKQANIRTSMIEQAFTSQNEDLLKLNVGEVDGKQILQLVTSTKFEL
jgi:Holliday junction resolvasome RuvABC endonuclease subunit